MAWDDLDSGRIEQIIRQITGKKLEESTEMVYPSVIKGTGVVYLWAPFICGLRLKKP
jgi:hypothetical protein